MMAYRCDYLNSFHRLAAFRIVAIFPFAMLRDLWGRYRERHPSHYSRPGENFYPPGDVYIN